MLQVEYDVVEELNIGDCKWRLVENIQNKRKVVQLWSTMTKQWNAVYKYECKSSDYRTVLESWDALKKIAKNLQKS
jgi:hypothetical protein